MRPWTVLGAVAAALLAFALTKPDRSAGDTMPPRPQPSRPVAEQRPAASGSGEGPVARRRPAAADPSVRPAPVEPELAPVVRVVRGGGGGTGDVGQAPAAIEPGLVSERQVLGAEAAFRHRLATIRRLRELATEQDDRSRLGELRELEDLVRMVHEHRLEAWRRRLGEERFARLDHRLQEGRDPARPRQRDRHISLGGSGDGT